MTTTERPTPAALLVRYQDVILTALRNEVTTAKDDERTMRELSGRHRHWSDYKHPLYANGEEGAVAMERLADAHRSRHVNAQAAMDALEELEADL